MAFTKATRSTPAPAAPIEAESPLGDALTYEEGAMRQDKERFVEGLRQAGLPV